MIGKALEQIVADLNDYLDGKYPGNLNHRAEIKNIQEANTTPNNDARIKVALINVEEDKVYKNHLNPLMSANDPMIARSKDSTDPIHPLGGMPAMRVNLYVLFVFNSASTDEQGYLNSLTLLTHVLRYFQNTTYQEITIPATSNPTVPEKIFTVEMERW